MMSQSYFPDFLSPSPKPTDRLFFGIFPPARVARCLAEIAQQLRFNHGLIGRPYTSDRFHLSLAGLGDFSGLPEDLVGAVSAAAAAMAAGVAPFDVTFDFVESFCRPEKPRALALRQSNEDLNLRNLLRQLLLALGLLPEGRDVRFTPHITLLYDKKGVTREDIVPITWTVDEIVLVHSLLGQSRYIPLGRWKLQG